MSDDTPNAPAAPATPGPPPAASAVPDTAAGTTADSPADTTSTTTADAPADTTDAAPAAADVPAEPAKRRRGRPQGSTARTTRTVELTLTVSGTADGDWQAELKQGSTWITRGLPVTATAVARAAQELHTELSEPIETIIGAAREQRQARVAALESELERARKALAEMDD